MLSISSDLSLMAEESNGIVINEICAQNTSFAAPDGGFYDWIEIYNSSSNAVNLSGYGLSDKENKPYKYIFPDNSVIDGKQRILIFCDSLVSKINGYYTAAFGLSTNGETIILTDPNGKTIDTVTFGQMQENVSYGRIPDGSENFAFMKMTPAAFNDEKNIISIDVPEPVLSNETGFYSDKFSLSIEIPKNTTVYYTLDGSQPTVSSNVYSSPIEISDISPSEGSLANITIKNNDSMGKVTVNTIIPDLSSGSWSGSYYTDYPVLLSAEPEAGYKFSYWETTDGKKIHTNSAEIKFAADLVITAVYEKCDTAVGDDDADGRVDSADVIILQKYLIGKVSFTSEQAACADISHDGSVNIFDMILLKKMCLAE